MRKPEWIQINKSIKELIQKDMDRIPKSCIDWIDTSRLVWEKFKKAVVEMETLCDKMRVKAKKVPEIKPAADETIGKLEKLKGENGIKYQFLEFLEQSEEELENMSKNTKEAVEYILPKYDHRFISLLCSLKTKEQSCHLRLIWITSKT